VVNTAAPWPTPAEAKARVLGIQTKLHRWATDDPTRRFDDLYNLVYDPAVLVAAWLRVKGNKGARTAGVDGETVYYVETERGLVAFLTDVREQLKARTFVPLPVRERMIPKRSGKLRRLGIATVRDRVVQAALKLVLEPIFEVGFRPCSYGFRPNRRAQDAIAEIHFLCSHSYEWAFEGDIEACFDEISHSALMDRVRGRIGDKRVLVKAFLKAGILTEAGEERDTNTGTPQGGILSPLLSNVALSILDDHFAEVWAAANATSSACRRRRREGRANVRLVRYCDDFVVLVSGTRDHAEGLREEVAAVLSPMGLRLSEEKTGVAHIDEGFCFLGFRIQRKRQRGGHRRHVYTYPSKDALASVKRKVRALTRQGTNLSLAVLLHQVNQVLRGWTSFFRHGASKTTFNYLAAFAWRRVVCWLRHKHPRASWKKLRRSYLPGWRPTEGEAVLFDASAVTVTRYRYRKHIPSPWEQPQRAVG
jgi:RNA-directed DNA polymerase